jgi:hypothetical protein
MTFGASASRLWFGILLSGDPGARTPRKPVRPKSVTHVFSVTYVYGPDWMWSGRVDLNSVSGLKQSEIDPIGHGDSDAPATNLNTQQRAGLAERSAMIGEDAAGHGFAQTQQSFTGYRFESSEPGR